MNLVHYFLIVVICLILFQSLSSYIRFKVDQIKYKDIKRSISIEVFYTLIVIYCTMIIGFGLIYFILSFNKIILVDINAPEQSLLGKLYDSIYFSGVTMLTIGYGDMTPAHIGRLIAVLQALIGYILPTAFVLKVVQSRNVSQRRNRHINK